MRLRFLLASILVTVPTQAQVPAQRVTDINTSQTGPAAYFSYWGVADSYLHEMVPFGPRVAFSADDGIHGDELWTTDGSALGTHMLADLCPGRCPSQPRLLRPFGAQLFFVANDGVRGGEPYVSDGTLGGTRPLGDLWPGQGTSRVRAAMVTTSQVFFVADSPGAGGELWRTDGTAAGTRLVRDLRPGAESSGILLLGALGGSVLFQATTDGLVSGLWTSDGTMAGTAPLPLGALEVSPNTDQQPVVHGNLIYFFANEPTTGRELWRTDGSLAGSLTLTQFPSSSVSLASLTVWNGRVFFLATGTGATELWSSDGSLVGTSVVTALPAGHSASSLNAGPNGLYFSGCDATAGCEPWFSDGTAAGTHRIREVHPGPEPGLLALQPWLGPAGSGFVFLGEDGVHGIEPWFSDGTAPGTRLLVDAMPGPTSGHGVWDALRGFERAVLGGRVFFWAASPARGFEPWASDGTPEGTAPITDINATASSMVRFLPEEFPPILRPTPLPGGLLVFASDHGIEPEYAAPESSGREPWFISHGDDAPVQLGDLVPGPPWVFDPQPVQVPSGVAFLRSQDLWQTDGTPAGTVPVAATAGLTIAQLDRIDSRLLVIQRTASNASVLRSLDLGLANLGSTLLTGSDAVSVSVDPVESRAFVSTSDLIVTDGTPLGTQIVYPNLSAAWFVPLDAKRVLFAAFPPATGAEPWVYSDVGPSPLPVADIRPGPESSLFPGLQRWESWLLPNSAAIGGQVLFAADDGVHGAELWASDGTAPGTRLVQEIRPGVASSDLDRLTAVGSRVYFVADDGVHGRELWLSDGTAPGTRRVRDLAPGPGSAVPQDLTAIGDFLVFTAWTPDFGRELWISDGTEVGTRRLTDIAPGSLSSSPVTFVAAGGWLYFTANDNLTGDELWRLPLALLQPGTIFTDGFESGTTAAWSP